MKKLTFIIIVFCVSSLTAQDFDILKLEGEPENLGPGVNSGVSDISPRITPDGKTLFFDRKYHPQNTDGTDDGDEIWFSNIQDDGTWGEAQRLGQPLNNDGNNWIESITPDGNSIFLANVYNYFDGSMSPGASISYRERGGWSFPKKQDIDDYENINDYVGFYLSNDSKVLLMSVQRKKKKENIGEKDIYVSFRTGENEWTKPKNLGTTINTEGEEIGPFLAADGVTLFYSTNGLEGFGDNDIYMSKRLDDTWTNWSKPLNVGPVINSDDWETGFTIPASGEYAYFVSAKSGYGKSDIFRIKLPQEAKPDPVVLVYGRVLNSATKEPLKANIFYETLPEGKEVGLARSEPENGTYKIVLPFGKQYGFLAKAKDFYAVSENLDLTDLKEYTEIEKDLYLSPIEVGEVVRLNNIFFEFGKAELKPESYPELDRVAKLLDENSGIKIELSGHTDNVGDDASNMSLSSARAQSVVEYLTSKGVSKGRLTSKGYGETSPVATNETEEGRAFNRRVEFKILGK
ncbi:MAG: OmpA family protein [Cyclobacteriaceae bacterium]